MVAGGGAPPAAAAVGRDVLGIAGRKAHELRLLGRHEHVLAQRGVPDQADHALELLRLVVLVDALPVDPQADLLLLEPLLLDQG